MYFCCIFAENYLKKFTFFFGKLLTDEQRYKLLFLINVHVKLL